MTQRSNPARAHRPRGRPGTPRILLCLAAGLLSVGCAARTGPVPSPPPDAELRTERLAIPEAALRVADRAELTGLEFGRIWTFDDPPLEYWEREYGFRPAPEWLEQLRLAALRYGQICSAAFVSPDGLALTNHHCVRECVEAVSQEGQDHVVDGFYAAARTAELECPDLYLDQLVGTEDVTERLRPAAAAGAPDTAVARARRQLEEEVEAGCTEAYHACEVVTFFGGGRSVLYRYRRYQPVRLVFAPELQAAFFGGDPDNFTYPRYSFDFAFVRAFQPDSVTPARTPEHLRLEPTGAREGDLVFLVGNPGSTSRHLTVSQLLYQREFEHPFLVALYEHQRETLQRLSELSPGAERQLRAELHSVENALKAYSGQLTALRDTLLLGRKVRLERELQARVAADPAIASRVGDAWDRIAALQADKGSLFMRRAVGNGFFFGYGAPDLALAQQLAAYVRESARPAAERPEELAAETLAELERTLRDPPPPNPGLSAFLLAGQLEFMRSWLPADDPLLQNAFRSAAETPMAAALRLVQGSRIGDAALRAEIMEGGPAALDASTDPLLVLARRMYDAGFELDRRWNELVAAEDALARRLGEAVLAVYGDAVPPDATLTLRISDGVISRYPSNGTFAPPFTSVYGFYERAFNFGGEMPWSLPQAFAARQAAVDLATPLNFVGTNDSTGGSSGSPVVDREGRLVGVAFDSNMEALSNEFVFREDAGRAIAVHAAAIVEALRTVYRTDALLSELLGSN